MAEPKGQVHLSRDAGRKEQYEVLLAKLIAVTEYDSPGELAYELLEHGWRQRDELAEWIRSEQVCGCTREFANDPAEWHPVCRGAEYAARIVESDSWTMDDDETREIQTSFARRRERLARPTRPSERTLPIQEPGT